jgi:ribosomal protein L11 methyltransferase
VIELSLLSPRDGADTVSDALMELEALSASVEDADADTPDEQPQFGEPGLAAPDAPALQAWQRSVVRALFADEDAATRAATLLLAQEWAQGVHVQALQPVADQDWVRLTQAQFAPVAVTERFWIVPSWHEPPAAASHVIRLDPGLAFGTGTHPTTRMCLRWIAAHGGRHWERVLDYGCGSGILAMGAALHGARQVDAVDIDPAAVQATRSNAQANGITLQAGLPDLADPARGRYTVVLANILATPLKLLAPLLAGLVAPGGHLVLAGLLDRQAEELAGVYAPWLALQVTDSEEGWSLLSGRSTALAASDRDPAAGRSGPMA